MASSVASMLMCLGLWICLTLFCCGGGRYADSNAYKVTYRVDGINRASLTYTNATGGTEQHEVVLPWTITFQGRYGEHLYLSAQDKGASGGVVVSISVNGRVVKDAISTERYGIASVSTFCCEY